MFYLSLAKDRAKICFLRPNVPMGNMGLSGLFYVTEMLLTSVQKKYVITALISSTTFLLVLLQMHLFFEILP